MQTAMLSLEVYSLESFMISKRMYLTLLHGCPKMCAAVTHCLLYQSMMKREVRFLLEHTL